MTKTKTKMRSRTKALIAILVLLALLLGSGGVLAAVATSGSNGDMIFPNVTMGGIEVGGLTVQEATPRLNPVAEDLADTHVVIQFPGGSTLEIYAHQAGLTATGEDLARLAYQFGRTGGFEQLTTYLRCRINTVHLEPITMLEPDRAMIRSVVAESAQELSDDLMQNAYEIEADFLIVTKGQLGFTFDEEELTEMIVGAFLAGAHTVINYETETRDPEPVDLQSIFDNLYTEPESAVYDIELDEVTDHVQGISFDLAFAQQLLDAAANGDDVMIPLVFTDPEITSSYLREVLFRDVLASSTTRLTNNENRNTNIHLAAQEINGMVLNPGEQFDFNTVVQRRTAERGFRAAGAFFGTETRDVIGGGICQVSSTIYHAVLHTELQVDLRRNHTLVVTYLPLGMDAAVSWGGPDFAFTNNTEFPLRIVTYRDGLDFHVRLYGTNRSNYRIRPEYVYIGSNATSTIYRDDPSMSTGETRVYRGGAVGHVVDTFQRFYDLDGNFIRRELVDRSNYHPQPRIVYRGTGTAQTPTPPTDPGTTDPPPPPPPDPPSPDPDPTD
ncbi:MAG: VanW family protein [Oscillospiraceae bacterium]|nr:VanW family protein [Oscillospiraceae bacterium]